LPLGFLERLNKRQPWSCPLGIRRFFVSPLESGELCLMASIMGQRGDIVYPKLDETRDMIPFDQVAIDLLHAMGMEPDSCSSEAEAREKCRTIQGSSSTPKKWPVYFFTSDTSGEKTFEEFFVPGETLDTTTFANLGVIKNAPRRKLAEIDAIFRALRAAFKKPQVSKSDIVEVLKDYLPNFTHIETGKSLDQKM
jgi:FlaA1/EpsC-like NDP-sugar epimerase